jgi:HlyD family secretion protein
MKTLFGLVVALGLVAGGVGSWYWNSAHQTIAKYRNATVERGDLVIAISANGTIEPEEVVDVGAQVVGRIKAFGRDPKDASRPIDYGTPVVEGTVLAQIDDATYQSELEQARANLKHAEADQLRSTAKLNQAERDWRRAENLSRKGQIPASEVDQFRANLEIARSEQALAEAAIDQAKAALKKAEISLGHTVIRSPIKGIVLDRRVNVGQTVVSSMNAPSLFLIAKDLTRMQVWASVNEADIGNIHPGQAVKFSVDAYPGETFHGTVVQIRLNASMTQNVVTYTVVVNADNSSGKLLPYLTANLQFQVSERKDVLLVPNAALRWRPTPRMVEPSLRKTFYNSELRTKAAPRRSSSTRSEEDGSTSGMLWVVADAEQGLVRPIAVKVGLSDGVTTEITSADLAEGTEVVVGETRVPRGTMKLPFLPKLGKNQARSSEKEADN